MCAHTCTHTFTHTPSHTHLHTHMHTYTFTHTPAHMHTFTHTCTHAHLHTHTCTHTPSHTPAHLHTHTPAHMHTHRELSFSISVPRFKIIYWSSVALQEGVECTLQEARFDLAYHLKLVPFSDGLQRRERANWAIQNCHGNMKNLTVLSCTGERRHGYPVVCGDGRQGVM